MMNPTTMHYVAKARQADLLNEAEQRRLVKQARAAQAKTTPNLLEGLVERLKGQRQAPQANPRLGWAEK